MSYKICTKCHKNKHISKSFSKDKSKPSGIYSSCKDCYRKRIGAEKRMPRHRINRKGETLRRCATCRYYKELRKFYGNASRKDGIHTDCKDCSMKRATTEASRLGRKGRRQRERMAVLLHYGQRCVCCGEIEDKFLAIDHIDGGGGKHRASLKTSHFYRWIAQNGFPKNLQILCHNCNYGRYLNGGICPHKTNETNIS